jgi:hypothetical protein
MYSAKLRVRRTFLLGAEGRLDNQVHVIHKNIVSEVFLSDANVRCYYRYCCLWHIPSSRHFLFLSVHDLTSPSTLACLLYMWDVKGSNQHEAWMCRTVHSHAFISIIGGGIFF